MSPECPAHDAEVFLKVGRECQALARTLADSQNRATSLSLTPNEAAQLAAVLRAYVPAPAAPVPEPRSLFGRLWAAITAEPCPPPPPMLHLKAKEAACVIDLLDAAGRAAVCLPAYSKEGASVTALVNALLNGGNLLEEIALKALPKETQK